MRVESLHHVSVLVTDLERSKAFYGGILGLEETQRPPFDFPGAWYQMGTGQIHLIVRPEKAPKPAGVDPSAAHLALRVDDYDRTVEHLKAHGIEVKERPDSITGWPQVYCADPDGNIIELNAAGRRA